MLCSSNDHQSEENELVVDTNNDNDFPFEEGTIEVNPNEIQNEITTNGET